MKFGGQRRHGTVPLGTILASFLVSTPSPVDALWCRFSAAVSLQVMRWLSGPAEKLPLRVAEGKTESSECVRALAVRAGVCQRFESTPSCEDRIVTFECIDD